VGGGLQVPLAAAGDETAHAEAAGILALLHLAEHRLHRGTALTVDGTAALGAQLALHALAGRQPLRHAPARRRRVAQLGALLAVLAGGDEQLALRGLAGGVVL
jgi:hypothetical protein